MVCPGYTAAVFREKRHCANVIDQGGMVVWQQPKIGLQGNSAGLQVCVFWYSTSRLHTTATLPAGMQRMTATIALREA